MRHSLILMVMLVARMTATRTLEMYMCIMSNVYILKKLELLALYFFGKYTKSKQRYFIGILEDGAIILYAGSIGNSIC